MVLWITISVVRLWVACGATTHRGQANDEILNIDGGLIRIGVAYRDGHTKMQTTPKDSRR